MKIIFILFILLLNLEVFYSQVTQEWAARYNGPPGNKEDLAFSVAVDDSGNVYTTGHSVGIGTGSFDYATIKYNSSGVQQWVARYNGTANGTDYGNAIAVDGAGNVYVTGASVGIVTGYYDYATVKYDASGDEQWVRRYDLGGGDFGDCIAVDDVGNIYVTGSSFGSGTGEDFATIKYNSSGDQLWVSRYGGIINSGFDKPHSLVLDEAGNVYVTGESADSLLFTDYATVKYNSSGVEQWASRYNGTGNSYDYAYSIAVGPSGNVYVTGSSAGVGSNADYATIKYSPAGVQQWVQRYNFLTTNVPDEAYSVAVDGFENVYVTGYCSRTFGNYDYATIKYNSSGDSLWVNRYNGTSNGNDRARALVLDESANVYVTGFSRELIGGDNYNTIKYNSSGVQQWNTIYNYGGNSGEDARSIALDSYGNVYVTGYSSTDTTLWDYATVKYVQTVNSVDNSQSNFPDGFVLEQNYPNPFNPSTKIIWQSPVSSHQTLKVYDVIGNEVAILFDEYREAGRNEITFDASGLSSGMYLYKLHAGSFVETKKMIIIK
jgi:uncharacterized delta-60 repeat protein